jgi:hypothetical protein
MNNGASGVKAIEFGFDTTRPLKTKFVCLILPLQTRMQIIMGEWIFPLVVQDQTPKGFSKKRMKVPIRSGDQKKRKKAFFYYMKGEMIHGLNKSSFNWHGVCLAW